MSAGFVLYLAVEEPLQRLQGNIFFLFPIALVLESWINLGLLKDMHCCWHSHALLLVHSQTPVYTKICRQRNPVGPLSEVSSRPSSRHFCLSLDWFKQCAISKYLRRSAGTFQFSLNRALSEGFGRSFETQKNMCDFMCLKRPSGCDQRLLPEVPVKSSNTSLQSALNHTHG